MLRTCGRGVQEEEQQNRDRTRKKKKKERPEREERKGGGDPRHVPRLHMAGWAGFLLRCLLTSRGERLQQALNIQFPDASFKGIRTWSFSNRCREVIPVFRRVKEKSCSLIVAVSARYPNSVRMTAASCCAS